MRLNIDLSDIADIAKSISNYYELVSYFSQLTDDEESELLREYWNTKIVKREKETWMTESEYRQWKEINFHYVAQMWSNTSCGWQGIGGSAMTNSYTLIIENKFYNLAYIYYGGKLAYICEMDDKYKPYADNGYRGLPGCLYCKDKLTVLYKSR